MQFAEIRMDHIWGKAVDGIPAPKEGGDLLAAISIDAWRTDDDNEPGTVLAHVLLSLHGDIIVDFHDTGIGMEQQVRSLIQEAKNELQKVWIQYISKHRKALPHMTSVGCTATLNIPASVMAQINGFLNAKTEDDFQGEDQTISYTAHFSDGKEMDIKCCGCQQAASWAEAVLFDEHGCELCVSETSDRFDGQWHLCYDGIDYLVTVTSNPDQ